MLNIGPGEIALIVVAALLVLGPTRLPQLARGIGKFMRELRRQTDEVRTTLETEFYRMDRDLLPKDVPPQPIPQTLTQLPPITGPLDGGRRVADELLARVGPVRPAGAAPDAEVAEVSSSKPAPLPAPAPAPAPEKAPAPAAEPVAVAATAAVAVAAEPVSGPAGDLAKEQER